ncbi:tetratricopeptide repeat protein [Neosynechococcus sphagnicola]|uniref:tetratricopeptide repeat protein n=1 Tax=Neosynechococcus sphagnicola TaxID=1501145 RepID=UPI00068EA8CD|nr:tetratricopeptide repeat protein [Neosynechococcus sphagnicola]
MPAIPNALEIGLRYHQSGQLQQAEQMYRQVLQVQPQHPDALHLLGVLAHQLGSTETAIACITAAIQVSPNQAAYHNSLGEVYRRLEQWQTAVRCYRQAIQLQPDYAEAHYNLGNALQAQGETVAAIASYQRALAIKPNLAPAHHNLGLLVKQQGQLTAAIAHYRQAIAVAPAYALAWNSLGMALETADQVPEAIAALQQAIALDPKYPEAHLHLGNVLKAAGETEAALASYHQALTLKPDWVEVYFTLGNYFKDQGQVDRAQSYYEQALAVEPEDGAVRWNYLLLLPVLYDTPEQIDHWRQRFHQGLQTLIQTTDLETATNRQQAWCGVDYTSNFYLQYQGKADYDLQRQYGQLVHRILATRYPQWTRPLQRQAVGRRIRVGFVSQHLREHTVAKLFGGWLPALGHREFEVFCYYTGKTADRVTAAFQRHSDTFHHIYNDFEHLCHQLQGDRLDILVFTDIGMNAESYKLGALRFAPTQCLTWGHPITSGLPTIDYYLSSDGMEPENAQEHYTETLVRLPQIGIVYAPPELPATPKKRAQLQLREDAMVYLCCQSLYKYLPQYDSIFAQIALQVPQAQFVFLASPTPGGFVTQQFQQRLHQAFADWGVDAQQFCVILPRLDGMDYLSLNLAADIFLDSLGWSGGNTTLEAIACGLPIVTCPGPWMRSRHAYAMLQVLDVTDTIAQNQQQYIEIAVRLGLDAQWREAVVAAMQQGQPQLFQNHTCGQALADFFRERARKHP